MIFAGGEEKALLGGSSCDDCDSGGEKKSNACSRVEFHLEQERRANIFGCCIREERDGGVSGGKEEVLNRPVVLYQRKTILISSPPSVLIR